MSAATATFTVPLPSRRVRLVALGLLVAGALALTSAPSIHPKATLGADPTTPDEHSISVSGTGRIILSPDTADLRLGVNITRPSVRQARDEAARAMAAVIASLKKDGIADKDLKTSFLSLQPTYDYQSNSNTPRITGYQLSNSVIATVRNLDRLGDAIDNALAAGATTLDGVTFRVDDQTKAEAQARTAAMTDAKAKADALAAAAGVTINGVISISETVAPVPYPIFYGGASDASGAPAKVPTPVQAGTNEVSVTVAVVYRIP